MRVDITNADAPIHDDHPEVWVRYWGDQLLSLPGLRDCVQFSASDYEKQILADLSFRQPCQYLPGSSETPEERAWGEFADWWVIPGQLTTERITLTWAL